MEKHQTNNYVSITGDVSPWPIYMKPEVYEMLHKQYGTVEEVFHTFQRIRKYLPYQGNSNHPVSLKCWNYALENKELGYKKWDFNTVTNGYEYQKGFYREETDVYIFDDGTHYTKRFYRVQG